MTPKAKIILGIIAILLTCLLMALTSCKTVNVPDEDRYFTGGVWVIEHDTAYLDTFKTE
jgi:hypothetical protein